MAELHGMKTGISYFGNRIPEHFVERDLPDIVAHGCTYIVHTFSENDLHHYAEALKTMVSETHKAGLEAYLDPWGVGGVFGGEAYSDFLPHNLDAWQVKPDGTPVPMACLNAPSFRAFMRRWVDAAVEIGADVIFWDEPHLYAGSESKLNMNDWTCWCNVCRELFQSKYGAAMPLTLTPDVAEFREDTVVGFLTEMWAYVKAQGPRNAVCLMPFDDDAHGVTHWGKVAAINGLDILGVTPFWQLFKQDRDTFVGRFSEKVVTLAKDYDLEPQLWLQAFLVPSGTEPELAGTAEIAARAGVRNIAAWGFRGCDYMSSLRSERPEEVWRIIGDVFRGIHSH
jgi:hypothetical protein